MIKVVGFDLDGTLAGEEFDKLIYNEEIPKLYAEKNKLSLEDAKRFCWSEYYKAKYIEKIPNEQWTNLEYWLNRLELKHLASPDKLLQDLKQFVERLKELK